MTNFHIDRLQHLRFFQLWHYFIYEIHYYINDGVPKHNIALNADCRIVL